MQHNNNVSISIIVPVYNVEQYLRRCVDSLVNQTYRNLEIILVDDGSPDRCGEICDDYAEKDDRIVVIHKPNGGLSDARNKGIDIARGDYIMFIDSDDWIEKEACKELVKIATKEQADIIPFGVNNVYDNGKIESYPIKFKGNITSADCIKALIYNIKDYGIFNYACNKMYSIDLFDNIRFQSGKLAEDQGMTYKLFHIAKRIYVCDKQLYNYYQRVGSISDSQYRPQLIVDRHYLWMERLIFIKKYYPELADMQKAQILGAVYAAIIKLQNDSNYDEFRKEIKQMAVSYKHKEKELGKYNRKVKLHYYCYPLFYLYVKYILK